MFSATEATPRYSYSSSICQQDKFLAVFALFGGFANNRKDIIMLVLSSERNHADLNKPEQNANHRIWK